MNSIEGLRAFPVGLLGYGRFGRAWSDLLGEAGWSLRAVDPCAPVPEQRRAGSLEQLVDTCRLLFVAVPLDRIPSVLEQMAPLLGADHLVMDVGSVKQEPVEAMERLIGERSPWVGTHPLFGPTSLALGESPLRVVVCPNPLHPGVEKLAREIFRELGCQVTFRDPAEHDRQMAESHALAYFVAKALVDSGLAIDSDLAPPSAKAIARTVDAVRSDAGHMMASLHRRNPYSGPARERFMEALSRVDDQLRHSAPDPEGEVPAVDPLSIPDLGQRCPELKQVRELIDEIDHDLIRLLARRARLARKAHKAKTEIGHGVRDVGREAALLARRREWAAEQELDPEDIGQVFEAIVRLSRRVQESRADVMPPRRHQR